MKTLPRERRPTPDPLTEVRTNRNEYIWALDEQTVRQACYPDTQTLIQKIAQLRNVSTENIILGAGGESIIRDGLICAKLNNINRFYIPKPNYAMYSVYANVLDVEIEYYDPMSFTLYSNGLPLSHELGLYATPTLVVFVTPSSPIGMSNFKVLQEYTRCRQSTHNESIFIIDSVYDGFELPRTPTILDDYTLQIFSFSKFYASAGLRVGYGLATGDLFKQLNSIRLAVELPFHSIEMAIRVLQDTKSEMRHRTFENLKNHFISYIKSVNFRLLESHGNSVTFRPTDITKLKEVFKQSSIHAGYLQYQETELCTVTISNSDYINKIIDAMERAKLEVS